GEGALGRFSARISTAYAVGLISEPVAYDLHLVRSIRNDFAHKQHGLSFSTDRIAQRVSELRVLKELRDQKGALIPIDLSPRKKFNLAVGLLLVMGIESRIEKMPKFESPSSEAITMTADNT